MRSIFISVLTVTIVFTGSYTTSFAQCSCEPKPSVREQFQRSDAVFVGRVVEAKTIRPNNDNRIYEGVVKFEVTQAWKRDLEKFVTVTVLFGGTDGFEPGAQWLLYASRTADGRLQISRNCCSRTKFLSDANGDFKIFRKMREQPKRIIDAKSATGYFER